MSKSSKFKYDEFDIDEIRFARISRKKQIQDRRKERRINHALKTKNIDEYMQYNDSYVEDNDNANV